MAHVSLILEDVSGFAGFVLLLKIMTVIYQNVKTAMALRSGMNHTKHLLLEEERYMVVLEERKGYFLLITAFYLDYDHALQKQLKHYKQYRSIQPSSSGQYFFSNPIDQSKEMDII